MKTTQLVFPVVICCGIVIATALFAQPRRALGDIVIESPPPGVGGAITGFAWSDNTGWLSLNCSDLATCGTVDYGLAADEGGVVTGYAWGEHIGWVSANADDLIGCPEAPCSARIEGGALAGWLKVLSGGSAEAGDWDGWISLGGDDYGVTQAEEVVSGFAWGDTVVGWLNFDASTTYDPCVEEEGYFCDGDISKLRDSQCEVTTVEDCSLTPGLFCASDAGTCTLPVAPSGGITVNPKLVHTGKNTIVSWSVSDATSCTVTSDNGDGPWTGVSGSQTSRPITKVSTYTLSCQGAGSTTLIDTATVTNNPAWREL